jgi:hypothetical protein
MFITQRHKSINLIFANKFGEDRYYLISVAQHLSAARDPPQHRQESLA